MIQCNYSLVALGWGFRRLEITQLPCDLPPLKDLTHSIYKSVVKYVTSVVVLNLEVRERPTHATFNKCRNLILL